jgi:hypothetical protein
VIPAATVGLAGESVTGGYWKVGGGLVYNFGAPFYGQL